MSLSGSGIYALLDFEIKRKNEKKNTYNLYFVSAYDGTAGNYWMRQSFFEYGFFG